jgi:hypothetical protein
MRMRAPTSGGPVRRRFRPGRLGAGVATAALIAGCPALVAVAASPASAASSFAAVSARPALPAGARATGALSASQVLTGDVALAPRDPSGLATYAADVSNPRSATYQRYLAPGEFKARFGPTTATVDAVTRQLRADGVDITSVSSDGLLVKFRATAAKAASAFHTGFSSYRLASGRTAFAPTSALALPASIAPSVQSVIGLNNLDLPTSGALRGGRGHAGATAPSKAATTATGPSACSAAAADASEYGGLTDQQIAGAYGVNGLYNAGDNGAGQTIAIYELEPFSTTDIQTFDTCYFGASKAAAMISRLKTIPVDGGIAAGAGSGESELDIDDVSGLAPGANIDVYEAPNTTYGYIDEFNQIVQDDTAKVVSSSWFSGCEAAVTQEEPGLVQVENTMFEQAAAQGQTVLDAAGDDGSDGCAIHGSSPVEPVLSAADPSSQPYVLAVGGTTISDATDPPSERVWNDGALWGAGGGGISSEWPAPAWQADSLVPNVDNKKVIGEAQKVNGGPFCGASLCREVPDVSAQADEFTGAATVYESQFGGWVTFGGTSSATPLWAAMLADVQASRACSDTSLGFVNPKLYAIASNATEYKASFNDITVGDNDTFGDAGGLYPATKGYDLATGLGSPLLTSATGGKGLAYYLCSTPSATVPTVTGVSNGSSGNTVPDTGGQVTITGTGFETTGASPASDVAGITVGTYALPASDYTVTTPTTITVNLPASGTQAGTDHATDGSGDYDVSVTLTDGQTSAVTSASVVTYYATAASGTSELPEVNAVQPGDNEAGGLTVNIYGSGFTAGSTSPATPTVTFGGVASPDVTLVNDHLLRAKVPPYSSAATTCASGDDPTTDNCQVEVVVTTTNGSSAPSEILPEFAGPTSEEGTVPGEELVPAPTEFDYFPTPSITSITDISEFGGLASEAGGDELVITGVGLGELGVDWVNVGTYKEASSEVTSFDYISPTQDVITLPGQAPTTDRQIRQVTVQTEGSPNVTDIPASAPSNTKYLTYAPTPSVSSLTVTSKDAQKTYLDGPSSGGTPITLHGVGLADTYAIEFTDVGPDGAKSGFSDATTYSLKSVTPTAVTFLAPSDNAGIDAVSACDQSGCSTASTTGDVFTYYPKGNPTVSSISKSSGPAGTKVTIDGANLGFVRAVYFGTVKAATFANVPALLDSGSTDQITATVPKGTGTKLDVRVETLESISNGSGKSPVNSKVTFTYTK